MNVGKRGTSGGRARLLFDGKRLEKAVLGLRGRVMFGAMLRPYTSFKIGGPADVLVDAMRGRFRTWTRVRVNLQHVPESRRPPQEPLDPDEDMSQEWANHPGYAEWLAKRTDASAGPTPRRRSKARKES